MSVRSVLAEKFPFLGTYRRWLAAFLANSTGIKNSYSQYGEDNLVLEILERSKIQNRVFVDVGGNHPSSYSNTYKMYRLGYRGIVIEPNFELISLHQRFRSGDQQIPVGCGSENQLVPFSYSKTPVLSSFVEGAVTNEWKRALLPVFRLDDIIDAIGAKEIAFLSIDVEGMDFAVLQGATKTLAKCCVICIEADNPDDASTIIDFLGSFGFSKVNSTHCNLIFEKHPSEVT